MKINLASRSGVVPASAAPIPRKPGQLGKHAGRAPRVPFALLVTGLIVGGLALLLLLNTVSAANEVRRHGLTAQDASVAAQLQELHNEVAASAAPGNLARAAAALGMVPAGNPAFLVVGSDGRVRMLGSPVPASRAALAQQPQKHRAKPAHAASPTPGRSPTRTAHSTTHATSAAPHPTPTPTVTLPGGNR